MNILDKIKLPLDLKEIPEDELPELCQEIRKYIIDECSIHPGHLGASLGVVELTVALHYVMDTPYDNLIWDVGHQSYAHKIITGRKEAFKTKRQLGGISGFPKISESEYDTFGTGHSSTSISAALGMAIAAKLNKEEDRQTIAVIGDGSMTGGMAFEGLSNAGTSKSNILIILNDNNMAIDPNTGGLNEYFLNVSTSKAYNKFKEDVWHTLGKIKKLGPGMRSFIQNVDTGFKSVLMQQSNLFEAMGLRYFGPVNGHDVNHLIKLLRDLKNIKGPKLLHCITVKGKGYEKAEAEQTIWHAPGKYNVETGERISSSSTSLKYQEVFGRTILDLAKKNDKIIGITPAMPTGCSLNIMMKALPERCFDVGIAEQHAVTFAAGLAAKGFIPFCNIYSTFAQRSYDQIIHDVALQKLNVVLCFDRGGLVGSDGSTHQGSFDLAFLRPIPNMTISAPMNESELRNMLYTAQSSPKGPFSIRYPRGIGVLGKAWETEYKELEIGKGRCIKEGNDIAIISLGTVGNLALKAIDECNKDSVALYDMRFLKPIDEDLLHIIFKKFKKIITIEDGVIIGGLGSAVCEFMEDNNYLGHKIIRLGIPDKFIPHGTQEELYSMCGFDSDSILKQIKQFSSNNENKINY